MLRDIENVCRAETLPHFRTLRVGGLFGYYGLFNGNEKWWVTNKKKGRNKIKKWKGIYDQP